VKDEDTVDKITFEAFVVSLATQALMQMGEMKPPDGMELPIDLSVARQTIEIVAMLQDKTKGNLSPEEERMLVEILHNLRMSFVRNTA